MESLDVPNNIIPFWQISLEQTEGCPMEYKSAKRNQTSTIHSFKKTFSPHLAE
jgi:hypothetical protein